MILKNIKNAPLQHCCSMAQILCWSMQRSPDEAACQVDVSFPRRLDEAAVTLVASAIAGVRETHEHRSEKWRKEEDSFLFHGFRIQRLHNPSPYNIWPL